MACLDLSKEAASEAAPPSRHGRTVSCHICCKVTTAGLSGPLQISAL